MVKKIILTRYLPPYRLTGYFPSCRAFIFDDTNHYFAPAMVRKPTYCQYAINQVTEAHFVADHQKKGNVTITMDGI